MKEKDKQLKVFYDQMNQQKEQFASEMAILKNHNKELKKNLIKQVAINKMQAKFTISITQSINEGRNSANPSMFDLNSLPSANSSSMKSLDPNEAEMEKQRQYDEILQRYIDREQELQDTNLDDLNINVENS